MLINTTFKKILYKLDYVYIKLYLINGDHTGRVERDKMLNCQGDRQVNTGINTLRFKQTQPANTIINNPFFVGLAQDAVNFTGRKATMKRTGNLLHVVSFTGAAEFPIYGVKSKVRGVKRHQKGLRKLEASNWKDGDPLKLTRTNYNNLWVNHPEFGTFGKLPPKVAGKLIPLMDKGYKFKCELAEVVGGFVGAPTLSLRVNIICDDEGENTISGASIDKTWDDLHKENALKAYNDAKIGDKLQIINNNDVLEIHHPSIGLLGEVPVKYNVTINEQVNSGACEATLSKKDKNKNGNIYLKFDYKSTRTFDVTETKEMIKDVTAVARDIVTDVKSKDFAFLYQPLEKPEEIVKTLVEDLPTINAIAKEIEKAKIILVVGHTSPDGDSIGCVLGLGNALKHIDKDVDCCIDDNVPGLFRNNIPGLGLFKDHAVLKCLLKPFSILFNKKLYNDDQLLKKAKDLNPEKKYDLVIVMDTPTPKRVGKINHFIKNKDTQLVVIDHHKLRQHEWDADKENTGIDLNEVRDKKLLWVNDQVAAATELVATLIQKVLPAKVLDSMSEKEKQKIAIPIVAGMMTDSGGFMRGAEYKLESFAKYLMDWAGFDKKWLRDNLTYNIPKEARALMYDPEAIKIVEEKKFSYGSLQVPYNHLLKIYEEAKKHDKDVIKKDIVNEFKYSGIFGKLRDNNKIAVLLTQGGSKEIDGEDVVSISVRSEDKSNFAMQIAENFGGGGHGAAAGAGLSGIRLDEKVFDDTSNPGEYTTLERKMALLAEEVLDKAKRKVVSFAGYLRKQAS